MARWGHWLVECVQDRISLTARCSGVGRVGPRVSAVDCMGQVRVSDSVGGGDDGIVYGCNSVFHSFSSEAL